ncbi:lipopolysaccharide heptosyltransferase I [Chthonobacter albigriseus]|uniref:lipopolysaccharide heptosyltransferase I n=1 Tax=Chthonobacter albigriseus TaxID=1683161 RepID=UPI0015EF6449|nr:lipopolysaccharide heptosyltransferase I [Chthonobacter albigriseus]
MKILVVKTSSMGDVIHTLPAVTDALAARPDLEIHWAVEPAFADLVRLHPGIAKVWSAPIRRWRKMLLRRGTLDEVVALRSALRAEAYDLVIDAQGLIKSALLARLTGRPVHGLDRASAREPLATLAYAVRHRVPKDLHAVDRTRLLFGAALGYAPDLEHLRTGIERAANQAGTKRAFLLHGTTWSSKRWPVDQWITLARSLVARGWTPEVTFSDPDEEAAARAIAAAVPEAVLHPRRPLGEVAETLAGCGIAVGVDTGLTHLAAGLGLPTIALFASTVPGLTGPRGTRATALAATTPCAPCRKRDCPLVAPGETPPCHATIGPDRVLAEIDRLP